MSSQDSSAGLGQDLGSNSITDVYGFDPTAANLTDLDPVSIICYLSSSQPEYDGRIGIRVSALFVILVTSTCLTLFPVVATRVPKLRIPLYVYLFARYFGAGVIIATAFIHLLDPAYDAIGPQTCVGMTGGWADYPWCAGLVLTSSMGIFLLDFLAERYVEKKYGSAHAAPTSAPTSSLRSGSVDAAMLRYTVENGTGAGAHRSHQHLHSGEIDGTLPNSTPDNGKAEIASSDSNSLDLEKDRLASIAFQQQFAAFLILEFGVIVHSIIIGLTLATAAWDDFIVLYPVIVFHQAFEGLGIGARLSAIPFPRSLSRWLPWCLCIGYGLSTPLAVAIGLGVRNTYDAGSFTANVVSGVLDAMSAGVLLYTGFVELLARDFLFNPDRTQDDKQLAFMIFCVLLGAGLMALLGKWA